MTRWRGWLATGALLAAGCRAATRPPEGDHARELRADHARLHARLEALLEKDALLAQANADLGQVVVAIRPPLVEALLQEVARRYLDHVVIELSHPIHVEGQGELNTHTFLGTVKAGDWKVKLTIHGLSGVLKAETPRLTTAEGNRVQLELPVVLEKGGGHAILRFAWEPHGLAKMVCKDFEVTETIEGRVLPDHYVVYGSFVLESGVHSLVARPQFHNRPFRLRIDLSAASWARVQTDLEAQDRLTRCGLALDPEDVLPKLKALGERGFDVKLPDSLFRPVVLPAAVTQSVSVEDRSVELSVRPHDLRVTGESLWYSATVRATPSRSTADRP